MTEIELLQDKLSTFWKFKELLIYLKKFRGISYGKIAPALKVTNTYISGILNEKRPATDKLLNNLEQFYKLDLVNQITEKKSEIRKLEREIEVLEEKQKDKNLEKFYAERVLQVNMAQQRLELNERKTDPINSAAEGLLEDADSGKVSGNVHTGNAGHTPPGPPQTAPVAPPSGAVRPQIKHSRDASRRHRNPKEKQRPA